MPNKNKPVIPNYNQWNVCAGGTSVPDGYKSYEFIHPNGRTRFYIDPIMKGSRVVYQLKSWRLAENGAWNWHGTVSHPNKAMKVFRAFNLDSLERLQPIIEGLTKPLPEGILVSGNGSSYLKPRNGSEIYGTYGVKVPENPVPLEVCAIGRTVLAQAENSEQAWEIVKTWLNRGKGVRWQDHAMWHLSVTERTLALIDEKFKEFEASFEKIAKDMMENPNYYI